MKVCALIGYGPGIGAAAARRWSQGGFAVALVSRTKEKLDAAAKDIPNSKPFATDVSDPAQLVTTLGAIEADMGPIDALIYNAGNGVWKKYDEITVDQMDAALKVNVHGLLAATQYCCPKMEARGEGFVCVTGATASLRGMPITSAFAAAKAAQRSLSQSIARQLWGKGVHVCYNIIDGQVGEGPGKIAPASIAESYWQLMMQPKDCWTFESHVQTHTSDMSLL